MVCLVGLQLMNFTNNKRDGTAYYFLMQLELFVCVNGLLNARKMCYYKSVINVV